MEFGLQKRILKYSFDTLSELLDNCSLTLRSGDNLSSKQIDLLLSHLVIVQSEVADYVVRKVDYEKENL